MCLLQSTGASCNYCMNELVEGTCTSATVCKATVGGSDKTSMQLSGDGCKAWTAGATVSCKACFSASVGTGVCVPSHCKDSIHPVRVLAISSAHDILTVVVVAGELQVFGRQDLRHRHHQCAHWRGSAAQEEVLTPPMNTSCIIRDTQIAPAAQAAVLTWHPGGATRSAGMLQMLGLPLGCFHIEYNIACVIAIVGRMASAMKTREQQPTARPGFGQGFEARCRTAATRKTLEVTTRSALQREASVANPPNDAAGCRTRGCTQQRHCTAPRENLVDLSVTSRSEIKQATRLQRHMVKIVIYVAVFYNKSSCYCYFGW